jgi:phosphoadenosine phosphosulfate reductase
MPPLYHINILLSVFYGTLVLLDLVSKALSPDEFYVIFSNTGMELSCTLDAVKKAKHIWKNLRFYEAACHMKPEETWDEFGIPGRRLRWCCQVHKSVPTILKMREITKKSNVKTVIFDGVRAEESERRSQYGDVSIGTKNINQINCKPIIAWGTSELFIYLLHNNILINKGYRDGFFRIGCKVCPMSSNWWDGIANDIYKNELSDLLSKVESYAKLSKIPKEQKTYIESGGWKARVGGRFLANGENRITETVEDDTLIFDFS